MTDYHPACPLLAHDRQPATFRRQSATGGPALRLRRRMNPSRSYRRPTAHFAGFPAPVTSVPSAPPISLALPFAHSLPLRQGKPCSIGRAFGFVLWFLCSGLCALVPGSGRVASWLFEKIATALFRRWPASVRGPLRSALLPSIRPHRSEDSRFEALSIYLIFCYLRLRAAGQNSQLTGNKVPGLKPTERGEGGAPRMAASHAPPFRPAAFAAAASPQIRCGPVPR